MPGLVLGSTTICSIAFWSETVGYSIYFKKIEIKHTVLHIFPNMINTYFWIDKNKKTIEILS
jgi:hypothetical protein